MATLIKMGKRGTLVLPVKLRKQFALEDGSLLLSEATDGKITLSPAIAYEVEVYTPERKAELLLGNAMTKEDWDETFALLIAEGIDPANFPSIDLKAREALPTDAEWKQKLYGPQAGSEHRLRA